MTYIIHIQSDFSSSFLTFHMSIKSWGQKVNTRLWGISLSHVLMHPLQTKKLQLQLRLHWMTAIQNSRSHAWFWVLFGCLSTEHASITPFCSVQALFAMAPSFSSTEYLSYPHSVFTITLATILNSHTTR